MCRPTGAGAPRGLSEPRQACAGPRALLAAGGTRAGRGQSAGPGPGGWGPPAAPQRGTGGRRPAGAPAPPVARRALVHLALRLAASATAAAALPACGTAGSGPRSAGGAVTLFFQGAAEPALHAEMLPRFEAAHRGLRVVAGLPPSSGRDAALLTALVAGAGPDVFWSDAPWLYLGRQLLLDLRPLVVRDHFDLGVFCSGQLLATTYRGGLFGLPRTTNPSAFAARTDVWSAAGVPLPEGAYTADELAAAWKALSVRGRRAGGELDWTPTATFYLRGWGAHLVDPADDLRCALNTPAAVACGQWMNARFWRDGSARGPLGQNGWAAFGKGSLGMVVLNAQALPTLAGQYVNLAWRLVAFPRWPAGPATATTSEFYGIRAGTAATEAAWLLLQFVTSAAWQRAAISLGLVCPARRALWPDYLAALRQALPSLRQQPLEVFQQAVDGGWTYPPEAFRFQPDALTVLDRYWAAIFGPARSLTVARGFAEAARAVTALELRLAREARGPA